LNEAGHGQVFFIRIYREKYTDIESVQNKPNGLVLNLFIFNTEENY
jgi:hypothetical protein